MEIIALCWKLYELPLASWGKLWRQNYSEAIHGCTRTKVHDIVTERLNVMALCNYWSQPIIHSIPETINKDHPAFCREHRLKHKCTWTDTYNTVSPSTLADGNNLKRTVSHFYYSYVWIIWVVIFYLYYVLFTWVDHKRMRDV